MYDEIELYWISKGPDECVYDPQQHVAKTKLLLVFVVVNALFLVLNRNHHYQIGIIIHFGAIF